MSFPIAAMVAFLTFLSINGFAESDPIKWYLIAPDQPWNGSFGSIVQGQDRTAGYLIKNDGDVEIQVSETLSSSPLFQAIPPNRVVTCGPGVLVPAKGSCTGRVRVTDTNIALGTYTALYTLRYKVRGQDAVSNLPLKIIVTGASRLAASANEVAFGVSSLGPDHQRVVDLLHTEGVAATGLQVIVSPEGTPFSVSKSCENIIYVGGKCKLTVKYDPMQTGTHAALLRVSYLETMLTGSASKVIEIPLSGFAVPTIAISSYQTCSISDGKVLKCWGANFDGELGVGTAGSDVTVPTAVNLGGRKARAISMGERHACAIAHDFTLWCWGKNTSGQLGLGTTSDVETTPRMVPLDKPPKQIFARHWHSCALLQDDTLKCWGYNSGGLLGVGSAQTPVLAPSEVFLGSGRKVKHLSSGLGSCAILDNNELKCWGSTYLGTPEGSPPRPVLIPETVTLPNRKIPREVFSDGSTFVVSLDGSLVVWGYNHFGNLGVGSEYNNIRVPTIVDLGAGRTVKSLAASPSKQYACALLDDGSVKCWGYNNKGQVGNGTYSKTLSPALVNLGEGRTAVSIWTGGSQTCVRLDNDLLKCWGGNQFGQVGNGSYGEPGVNVPTQIDFGENVRAKSCLLGYTHSCSLVEGGSLYCWGHHGRGAIGIGPPENERWPFVTRPTQVPLN